MNRSQQHVDEDIRNLSVLGEEFMEVSQKMGLGYRQLRQLRALPEEEQGLMYEADGITLRTDDPEVLKEWVEEALPKNAKVKEELKAVQEELQVRDKVLETKNKALDAAQTQLLKLKTMNPEAKIALMGEKEAKGREELALLGAETLVAFSKLLAMAAGIQATPDISVTAAQDSQRAVSNVCSSMAELIISNGFDIDFQSVLFPEWMASKPETDS